MRYLIKPRERRYVKGYGFLSFPKNIGKNLSNKYGQKLVDSAKKSATDALKTGSKRAIQKTAETTGDLGDDYTTGCLLKYPYFKDSYNVDLSKQQALDANTRAIQ